MAENINLIPANELPEAIGEEVSVLCVENGELKQKAASGLGGGDTTLCRTYTSDDIVLGASSTSGHYIVDPEMVAAVLNAINNKTPMPQICFFMDTYAYIPQRLRFAFGTSIGSRAFDFAADSKTIYIFDTYENAFDYYDR